MNTLLRRIVAIALVTFLGPLLSVAAAQVGCFQVKFEKNRHSKIFMTCFVTLDFRILVYTLHNAHGK